MAKFITIEGGEGVGKSTALRTITQYLSERNIDFIATREPGGTLIAEQIRQLLLQEHEESMASDTELLLMFASRAQHINQLIIPNLQAGRWVICDRFTDATYAYQGGGRGIDMERISVLESWVQGSLRPDYTLLLDAPVELCLERAKQRGALDRIEQEGGLFFERIRQAYLELAARSPERFHVIDASLDLDEVSIEIKRFLSKIILSL